MSEDSVKRLMDLAPGAVIHTDTLVDRRADLLSAIDARDAEIERLNRNSYPHMCRMDHEQIGHRDSENERCPVCRRDDEIAELHKSLALRGLIEAERAEKRSIPTLAEVAKDLMAAIYANPDRVARGVVAAAAAIEGAEALLAELERRGK